jgi:hypothetical protein
MFFENRGTTAARGPGATRNRQNRLPPSFGFQVAWEAALSGGHARHSALAAAGQTASQTQSNRVKPLYWFDRGNSGAVRQATESFHCLKTRLICPFVRRIPHRAISEFATIR